MKSTFFNYSNITSDKKVDTSNKELTIQIPKSETDSDSDIRDHHQLDKLVEELRKKREDVTLKDEQLKSANDAIQSMITKSK